MALAAKSDRAIVRLQYGGSKAETIRSSSANQDDMERIYSEFLVKDLRNLYFGNALPKKSNVRLSRCMNDALELGYDSVHQARTDDCITSCSTC